MVGVSFDGGTEIGDGALIKALLMEHQPPIIIDEHQVLGRQLVGVYGLGIEMYRLVEVARVLRLERGIGVIKGAGPNRGRQAHEGNNDNDQQPTNHRRTLCLFSDEKGHAASRAHGGF